MVRAIIEGRKTMTRRVCKTQPITGDVYATKDEGVYGAQTERSLVRYFACPQGQIGDRLWVRETWGIGTRPDPRFGWVDGIEYKADDYQLEDNDLLPLRVIEEPDGVDFGRYRGHWSSPRFMPRWASRILLEVVTVRVERVQDISAGDVYREGAIGPRDCLPAVIGAERSVFANLWDSINAKRGYGWSVNPWVWVVEFKRVEP